MTRFHDSKHAAMNNRRATTNAKSLVVVLAPLKIKANNDVNVALGSNNIPYEVKTSLKRILVLSCLFHFCCELSARTISPCVRKPNTNFGSYCKLNTPGIENN